MTTENQYPNWAHDHELYDLMKGLRDRDIISHRQFRAYQEVAERYPDLSMGNLNNVDSEEITTALREWATMVDIAGGAENVGEAGEAVGSVAGGLVGAGAGAVAGVGIGAPTGVIAGAAAGAAIGAGAGVAAGNAINTTRDKEGDPAELPENNVVGASMIGAGAGAAVGAVAGGGSGIGAGAAVGAGVGVVAGLAIGAVAGFTVGSAIGAVGGVAVELTDKITGNNVRQAENLRNDLREGFEIASTMREAGQDLSRADVNPAREDEAARAVPDTNTAARAR